jgi:hypothetical protein
MSNYSLMQLAAAAGAGLIIATPGRVAADDWAPVLTIEVPIEVQNDWAYESDDPSAEFNTLSIKAEPSITVEFGAGVSLVVGLVLEPVQEPSVAGDHRTFDDQGLFVEVLALRFESGPLSLYGGKFGPNFAIVWDAAPGVYGTDLVEEYEISERIGLGGAITWEGGDFGAHTVSASTFFLDTSGLAESAFTRRKKTRDGDGGPGNTGGFDSVAGGLDGTFPWAPGFRYHFSTAHLGQGVGGGDDESRFAIAAEYAIAVTDDLSITPLVEWVDFHDADGTDGTNRDYLTGGLGLSYGSWNLAFAGTRKETETGLGAKTNEEQVQVSIGYAFEFGLGVDVGWKRTRNDGIDTDTAGTLLSYTVAF